MDFTKTSKALEQGKGTVKVRGWAYRVRKHADKIFIVVRDSEGLLQAVIDKAKVSKKEWELAEQVTVESSVILEGSLAADKRAPGGFELKAEKLEVVQIAERFPITRDLSQEFLLDVRHLSIRSRKLTLVFRIRSTLLGAIHQFFREHGYYEFTPPILTPLACEGGATLFKVDFFGEEVYLTQSWQLYAEAGIFSLEKIYCVSPCFRAERSKTARHLAEFMMAEVETAWQSFEELQKQAEELVSFIVQEVVAKHEKDLVELGHDIAKLKKIKPPFQRITYSEALKLLAKDGVKIPWGKDLRTIEEDIITKHFDKPVIVTHYPKEIMAFYKPRDLKDPKTALCFDMLAPEGYGEIIGGSQRDTDIEALKKALKEGGEKIDIYEWYFDTRRYGSVPHAGFGMGVERVVAWLCKLDSIKDAIPFPRTMRRKYP